MTSGVAPPVLVVGSYPPIPVPGAPATVAEVRRAWAAGDEVTVVSPRLSAAHLAVPVFGELAGRRLRNVARHTGARRLVLVVEEGFPFPSGPAPRQLVTALVLLLAFKEFGHVRLVRAGSVSLPTPVWNRLAAAADEVAEAEPGPAATGVTPLGPPEVARSELPAHLADRAARRLLGPQARAWLRSRRSLRRLLRRP